jgi:hypothetical protein
LAGLPGSATAAPPPLLPPLLELPLPFRWPGGGLFPTSILYSLSGPCWALSDGLLPAILLSVLVMTLFAFSLADCTVAADGAGRWGAFRRKNSDPECQAFYNTCMKALYGMYCSANLISHVHFLYVHNVCCDISKLTLFRFYLEFLFFADTSVVV